MVLEERDPGAAFYDAFAGGGVGNGTPCRAKGSRHGSALDGFKGLRPGAGNTGKANHPPHPFMKKRTPNNTDDALELESVLMIFVSLRQQHLQHVCGAI